MVKRIDYLDITKFIGLILVCFCHIPYPEGYFHVWVYSFHMPLFFMLSGVFFSLEKFSVGKSVMQLLVPFILFNIISLIVSMVIGSLSTGALKLPNIDWSSLLHSNYPIGPSWFLLSLCIIRVFTGLILKYFKMRGGVIAFSIGVMLVFYFTRNSDIWITLNIGSSVLGWPFYLIGYYLKDIIMDEKHFSKLYVLIPVLILSILSIYNGQVGIHASDFGDNIILFILFGIVGTLSIISLSTWLKLPQRVSRVFMDGALFIICMHTLIFEYLILCWRKITGDFTENTLTGKVVFTVLTFAVSYPVILAMLKYTPLLLGKRKSNKTKWNEKIDRQNNK